MKTPLFLTKGRWRVKDTDFFVPQQNRDNESRPNEQHSLFYVPSFELSRLFSPRVSRRILLEVNGLDARNHRPARLFSGSAQMVGRGRNL